MTMVSFSRLSSLVTVVVMIQAVQVIANPDAKRLYDDLLRKSGYNKLIRPVGNNTDKLTVKLGLRLSQLIDVDEKNQIMTTNVWLVQEWNDYKLEWDPKEYGGVDILYVPSEEIWLPDIVLYNNADGNYEVTLMTKATIYPTGVVHWEPPAIYKSSCTIDVEFFPFDEQLCTMKFGSWTYDGLQVDLKHARSEKAGLNDYDVIEYGIDLKDFYRSVEWDLLAVPARKNEKYYTCCTEPYPDITFNITIRRKTLFHTVNLIIPCVAITFLTVIVFHLPSDSGEKIALCISILLSLTVFFLLLAEIIPPTSLVVPLIGKYLLFTMVLVTLSIIVTVVVLNVHFRSPSTHTMAPWVRRTFLVLLPRLLFMQRPVVDRDLTPKVVVRTVNGVELRDTPRPPSGASGSCVSPPPSPPPSTFSTTSRSRQFHASTTTASAAQTRIGGAQARGPSYPPYHLEQQQQQQHADCRTSSMPRMGGGNGIASMSAMAGSDAENGELPGGWQPLDESIAAAGTSGGNGSATRAPMTVSNRFSPEVTRAIEGVKFIAEHLKREDEARYIKEDWKYIALVLDRLFLWIFTTACTVGTLGIILQAPTIYDSREPVIERMMHQSPG